MSERQVLGKVRAAGDVGHAAGAVPLNGGDGAAAVEEGDVVDAAARVCGAGDQGQDVGAGAGGDVLNRRHVGSKVRSVAVLVTGDVEGGLRSVGTDADASWRADQELPSVVDAEVKDAPIPDERPFMQANASRPAAKLASPEATLRIPPGTVAQLPLASLPVTATNGCCKSGGIIVFATADK